MYLLTCTIPPPPTPAAFLGFSVAQFKAKAEEAENYDLPLERDIFRREHLYTPAMDFWMKKNATNLKVRAVAALSHTGASPAPRTPRPCLALRARANPC